MFLFLFLFSCQNEYVEFHENKKNEQEITNITQDFSFENIEYLSGVTLKNTPDLKLLDELVSKIDSSKNKVYLEVYIFTEKRIRKALIDAHKRGVDVKVILEKNVYKAPSLNTQAFKELEKAGISIVYSNPENYSLNHSKMMIVDDEVILSTGNYSYSTFRYNREFFVFIKNEGLQKTFGEIFQNDFDGVKKNIYHNNLILSPFSSRIKLEYLLKNAKKSIKIYAHNFSDNSVMDILLQKQKENIEVKMIFPDFKKVSSNQDEVEKLQQNNISINIVDKPEIHAKSILIDDEYLYIGSVNFSSYSIDKNREIGILLKNSEIITQFLDIFEDDFYK
ncbi:MAG: phosphatidylserine/phosphatidylglycerophosphate/cardiolipin synthase family protein [Candidatus Altimarinota bacterium]